MMRALAAVCLAAGLLIVGGAAAETLRFADLPGWAEDDHAAALATFRKTCGQLDGPEWEAACAAAAAAGDARSFFERHFRPVAVGGPEDVLFTGYYEPELVASPIRTPRYAWPIYRKPPELTPGKLWFSRAEIESQGLLRGRGLEIAWLDDPVDVFFLQVQGSGRLHLTDGRVLRVGFAAKNGHPYRSVGAEMVRLGLASAGRISARVIRAWVKAHPEEGRALLQVNPSFIFFREVSLAPDLGPFGAMAVPITAGRSLAVDPALVPLGAPVWIETRGRKPLHRLMVAQDKGSAIKGRRADIFIGSGPTAGKVAGAMKDKGRMIVLLPLPLPSPLIEAAR